MKQNTADAQLKEFKKGLVTKPQMDTAFRAQLKDQVMSEYAKGGLIDKLVEFLKQPKYALATFVAAFALIATIIVFGIQPNNLGAGNGTIATSSSSTETSPQSFPGDGPEITDCEDQFKNKDYPFTFDYSTCEREIETSAREVKLFGLDELEGEELRLTISEINASQLKLAECSDTEFELTDFGVRVKTAEGRFKYLKDFVQDSENPTKLCQPDYSILLETENKKYIAINILFNGEKEYATDEIVDSLEITDHKVVDQMDLLPEANFQRVRLSRCDLSLEIPKAEGVYPFPGQPETVASGDGVLYSPFDYRGMLWKNRATEYNTSFTPGVFDYRQEILISHPDEIERNYVGVDGISRGEVYIYCGTNRSLENVVARVEGILEESASDAVGADLVFDARDTTYGEYDAIEVNTSGGLFYDDNFTMLFIDSPEGVVLVEYHEGELDEYNVYNAASVVDRDLERIVQSLEF